MTAIIIGISIIGATFGTLTWILAGAPIDLKKEVKKR